MSFGEIYLIYLYLNGFQKIVVSWDTPPPHSLMEENGKSWTKKCFLNMVYLYFEYDGDSRLS